ncbi:Nephrocystin-3, partial [Pseudolycoriella hygida]
MEELSQILPQNINDNENMVQPPQPHTIVCRDGGGPINLVNELNGSMYSITNYSMTGQVDPNNIYFRVATPEADFTGRLALLAELMQISASSDAVKVAVSGMGGVGKTQLVRKFIEICITNEIYRNIIWIDAETKNNIDSSFSELSTNILELKTVNANGVKKSLESIIEQVYLALASRKTLFVFDNVDSYDTLNFIMTKAPLPGQIPHIIVTSQLQKWPNGIKRFNLEVWTSDESIDFVSTVLTNDSEDDKRLLVETLQYFPLALRQATSYIKSQREIMGFVTGKFSTFDYVTKFKNKTEEILKSTDFQADSSKPYEMTTYSCWLMTMETIQNKQPHGRLATKMLNMMAYFLPDNIAKIWFLGMPCEDESLQMDQTERGQRFAEAIQLLVNYSIVDSKHDNLAIHRLVQEVLKLRLKKTNEEEETLRTALKMLSNETGLDYAARNHKVSIFDFASIFPDLIEELSSPSDSKTMSLIASCYIYKKKHADSLVLLQKLLKVQRYTLGDNDSDTLLTMDRIADAYTGLKKLSQAHRLRVEIYETKKRKPTDELDILRAKQKLAYSHYKQKNFGKALKLYEEIYDQRKIKGEDHPDTLIAKHNVAMAHSRRGDLQMAIGILEEIYVVKKRILGDGNLDTLRTKSKIAQHKGALGLHKEALELYREIYDRREFILGPKHVETLSTKVKIGIQLGEMGKHVDAVKLFQEIYSIEREILEDNNPATLCTKSRIAQQYVHLWNHKTSFQMFWEVYAAQHSLCQENRRKIILFFH